MRDSKNYGRIPDIEIQAYILVDAVFPSIEPFISTGGYIMDRHCALGEKWGYIVKA